MNQFESISMYKELFSPCHKATELLIEKGDGPYLFTSDGERYLDMVQGIAVNALGHSNPVVLRAAIEQMKKICHGSFNLVNFPSTLELAFILRNLIKCWQGQFFFTNTGSEAVEGGLKLARYITKRNSFLAFRGGFHGRTMGAASLTSSSVAYRKNYSPFLPQVYFAPYPYCYRCSFNQKQERCNLECLSFLKEEMDTIIPADDLAAAVIEPVMGEGGYIVPPEKYLKGLAKICQENGILLIFDEVQTGVGRTGRFLSFEHFEVVPDVIIMGKALGGGFPLGVVAARSELMSQWKPGAHGTTFGGHPVAAASAIAVLSEVSKPTFLEQVRELGTNFYAELQKLRQLYPVIGDVRGLGLMIAIEIVKEDGSANPEGATAIQKSFYENHILVLTCGMAKNVIRFIPPLNISFEILDLVTKGLKLALPLLKQHIGQEETREQTKFSSRIGSSHDKT